MRKKKLLIYLQNYLSPSMTFIYRQMIQVQDEFDVFVVTSRYFENLNQFPFQNVRYLPKNRGEVFFEKVREKFTGATPIEATAPSLSFFQRQKTTRFCKENKIELIHAHFGPSGMEILPVAKKLKIPLVVTFHGYDVSLLLNYKIYIINLKKLLLYTYAVSVSRLFDEKLNELFPTVKSAVIHCGIPLELFQFHKRERVNKKYELNKKIIFLQVSNFVEKKGHQYTISAFKQVLDFYPNCVLILAGDGSLRSGIEKLCKDLRINQNVVFKGKVDEKEAAQLMTEADIFLHHSVTSTKKETEGIPTALMEAMATGLPVVSTYHAGIPELVIPNETGFLVEEKNIEQYVNILKFILTNQLDVVTNARLHVEKFFNLRQEVIELKKLYHKISD